MMFILKFGQWFHVEAFHGVASARLWSRAGAMASVLSELSAPRRSPTSSRCTTTDNNEEARCSGLRLA
jgi:hypothetical protein